MSSGTKPIVVFYHSSCPDGFGGAYAAWKKFGDSAEYIPISYNDSLPTGLEGKEVYVIDFSFDTNEKIDAALAAAKKLVILDHHLTNKPFVERVPEHVFDLNRSGATIAWSYFHPGTPVPFIFQIIEDGDLYFYARPETRDIYSYLVIQPNDFAVWDDMCAKLEDPTSRAEILRTAKAYTEYFKALAHMSIDRAKKVRFEGHEVLFSATHPNVTMRSYVAHELYTKVPPFSIIATAHPDGLGITLRGDSSIDVSKLAEKYGGGGHKGSAGFFVPYGEPIPWTPVPEEE